MFRRRKSSTLPLVLGILLLAAATFAQESATPLLKLQSSKADLNLDTNVVHGQGMTGITYGKSGDVFSYPSSLACLVVYGDGKFVIEKREEPTVGEAQNQDRRRHLGRQRSSAPEVNTRR